MIIPFRRLWRLFYSGAFPAPYGGERFGGYTYSTPLGWKAVNPRFYAVSTLLKADICASLLPLSFGVQFPPANAFARGTVFCVIGRCHNFLSAALTLLQGLISEFPLKNRIHRQHGIAEPFTDQGIGKALNAGTVIPFVQSRTGSLRIIAAFLYELFYSGKLLVGEPVVLLKRPFDDSTGLTHNVHLFPCRLRRRSLSTFAPMRK